MKAQTVLCTECSLRNLSPNGQYMGNMQNIFTLKKVKTPRCALFKSLTNYALSEPYCHRYSSSMPQALTYKHITTLKGLVAFQEPKSLYLVTYKYSRSQMRKGNFKEAVYSPLWINLVADNSINYFTKTQKADIQIVKYLKWEKMA